MDQTHSLATILVADVAAYSRTRRDSLLIPSRSTDKGAGAIFGIN
jgi:hypothetical protein